MRLSRTAYSRPADAQQLVVALTEYFPDLRDASTADIVRDALHAFRLRSDAALEIILDSPYCANWRLRADLARRGHTRIACYRHPMTPADQEREEHLNTTLWDLL